ncbi:MAG: MoaD/ThiS family protein [Proteobacteria bacterium]|nr:MoaD/ThiS family protein [Pseudomonadota bacterium]
MQVTVKLFGALREFLPAGSGFNSCQLSIASNQVLGDLLSQLPIPAHKPYLVIINDEKINQQDYLSTNIQEQDEIVLLPPIKGG